MHRFQNIIKRAEETESILAHRMTYGGHDIAWATIDVIMDVPKTHLFSARGVRPFTMPPVDSMVF